MKRCEKKFSLCIAGHIVYIALNTLVVMSIFRHEYVSAFFDFISFGVQCTNQECKQFIRTLYFLGIDFLKNIGTGACFLTLKIQGTSEMSNFASVFLIRQKKKCAAFPPILCEKKPYKQRFVDSQFLTLGFCGSTKTVYGFLWIHKSSWIIPETFVDPQLCDVPFCVSTILQLRKLWKHKLPRSCHIRKCNNYVLTFLSLRKIFR